MINIFPLNLAVLPKEIIPLHIFEDRYKVMISNSIKNNEDFGIIYKQDEQISDIGCTVSVHEVIKYYEDGKYDILVKGNKRFKIINYNKNQDLWSADVEFLDEKYHFMDKKTFSNILDKYLKVLLSFGANYNIQDEINKTDSFDFTKHLIIPVDIKQEFLGLKNESERMFFIEEFLDSVIRNSSNSKKLPFKNKTLN